MSNSDKAPAPVTQHPFGMPRREPLMPREQSATAMQPRPVWVQANQIFHALADVSAHCRRTANELEANLKMLERMLGQMPAETPKTDD